MKTAAMNKLLAKIDSAKLSLERGILHFWIFVDYEDGGSQGIGGFALDRYCPRRGRRIGTAYGCEMIRSILDLFDVDDLSELKNKYVYVLSKGTGFNIQPLGLKTLNVEGPSKTLIFEDVLKEFMTQE